MANTYNGGLNSLALIEFRRTLCPLDELAPSSERMAERLHRRARSPRPVVTRKVRYSQPPFISQDFRQVEP